MGFGGAVEGGCWALWAKAGVDETMPGWYGVVEGMGEGAADGRTHVGYGPWPLKSRWTFCSNCFNTLGSMLSCHSRYEHIPRDHQG